MNFHHLFTHNIDEYCQQVFDPKKMLFYMHIPKCSGTSSVNYLKKYLKRNWHFQYNRIEESWPLFLKNSKEGRLQMAAGHFAYQHFDNLKENEVPHYGISFMRHPVKRIISEYRYMCTPAHPPYQEFIQRFPTFEDFVNKRVQPNAMAKILVGGSSSFDEYLQKLKEGYSFIGLTEFYNLSMAILMTALGHPYQVEQRRNTTKSNSQNTFEVSHKTYERLMEMQSLDVQMFNYLYNNYIKLSDRFIGQMHSMAPETISEQATEESE